MAKIVSIATEVPAYQHTQQHLLEFLENAYGAGERERRILAYLYHHSGIDTRYSVMPDFTAPMEQWEFFPKNRQLEPFPSLEHRMRWFARHALPLSLRAALKCIDNVTCKDELSHLITVSCTGMSAPGLELQLMEAMGLQPDTCRTAINFMGCYAAIHGMKMAKDIVAGNPAAKVLVVCTELCSLHFQKNFTENEIIAPVVFGDGSAAMLVCGDDDHARGLSIDSFYSEIIPGAKYAMTWSLSSLGFIMGLSPDVPDLFRREIGPLRDRALARAGVAAGDIRFWGIHPGGKRILQGICEGLSLTEKDLLASYKVLREYGNMSSPTILFVLAALWDSMMNEKGAKVFGAAFGPGLAMESVILSAV